MLCGSIEGVGRVSLVGVGLWQLLQCSAQVHGMRYCLAY
jgi:hypothetical protein